MEIKMTSKIESALEKLTESLLVKNQESLNVYSDIKKNNVWLAEDEFSHYKFLNSLSNEFFQSNSFLYEYDKEGFLCLGERIGQKNFLGLFVNLNPKIDMNLSCSETFQYQEKGYCIESQRLLDKKVILLSLLSAEGRPMVSKAIMSYVLFEVSESKEAKDQQFSRVFSPLGPLSSKLGEKEKGFFALVDQELDFEEIKKFKNTQEEVCFEWVTKTKAHNSKIRKDLSSLKGGPLED